MNLCRRLKHSTLLELSFCNSICSDILQHYYTRLIINIPSLCYPMNLLILSDIYIEANSLYALTTDYTILNLLDHIIIQKYSILSILCVLINCMSENLLLYIYNANPIN